MMKILKKSLAWGVALLVMLSLAACTPKQTVDANVGIWRATEVSILGKTVLADDIFTEGFTIELKSDGVAIMTAEGNSAEGTWAFANGIVTFTFDEQTFSAGIEGMTMTLENWLDLGMDVTFVKQPDIPGGPALPPEGGGDKEPGSNGGPSTEPINGNFSDAQLREIYQKLLDDKTNDPAFITFTYEDIRDRYFDGVEADEIDPNFSESSAAYYWHASDAGSWMGGYFKKDGGTFFGLVNGNNDWQ